VRPIDYPADFEVTVSAALAHPCRVDSRGNLYALRDDGASILIAGPELLRKSQELLVLVSITVENMWQKTAYCLIFF
jgi:hypothetical protein